VSRIEEAGALRQQGMTYRQICQAMKISAATAYAYVFASGGTRGQLEHEMEEETPRQARARVARELADGTRCGHRLGMGVCCLLNPCSDHEAA
jgi:transposase